MASAIQNKPRVFIGSSTEGIEVARALQSHLDDIAEVTLWRDGAFKQNQGYLEALLRMLDYYDFAVFAFTPDDSIESRDKKFVAPRDNVLFEFGLFLGALREERCFAVISDHSNLKLPSDMHGVTVGRYCASRDDGNLVAATATACAMIKNEMQKLGSHDNAHPFPEPSLPNGKDDETIAKDEQSQKISERWGIEIPGHAVLGRLNQSQSSWFHGHRFTKAFPGVRGISEINDSNEAIDRLSLLFQKPLAWIYEEQGILCEENPVWWWRGTSNMHVSDFRRLSASTVLIDEMELSIRKVVAVNMRTYWQSFVYVECNAQQPTGLYKVDDEIIQAQIDSRGYADEEYAVYKNRLLTRAEYDDGAAVIDGKPQRVEGAELRVRFLTSFNFIIAPQHSPINNNSFDLVAERILDAILKGNKSTNDLAAAVLDLPRNSHDARS